MGRRGDDKVSKEMDVHQRVREQFGGNAQKYVTCATHAKGDDLDRLVPWLKPTTHDLMLDIATGGGHVAKTLAPHVKTVYVTDLTPQMLTAARNHLSESGVGNAVYMHADAESLPFLPATFDIVTCRIAAHHFPHPELFLKEVTRVLKPGGRFVLIDNVAPERQAVADFLNLVEAIRDPSHIRCLSVSEWTDLLRQSGLSIRASEQWRRQFDFQSWVERMAPTTAHMRSTEATMRLAPADIAEYFEITVGATGVETWASDQWMVLADRT
jgi:ubiquinone/menaquinone biosynthesis C-methylase UbiE